jgi:hypothetical protein
LRDTVDGALRRGERQRLGVLEDQPGLVGPLARLCAQYMQHRALGLIEASAEAAEAGTLPTEQFAHALSIHNQSTVW